MKRKRYTYIPKDEIAEIRTFNDVSFESDDLLDGAYVKGRKKFARGGMPSRQVSLEEQAAEAVGRDTWFAMDAVDQKELVKELVSSGMITPMMANGGDIQNYDVEDAADYLYYKLDILAEKRFDGNWNVDYVYEHEYDDFYKTSYTDAEVIQMALDRDWKGEKTYAEGGELEDYDVEDAVEYLEESDIADVRRTRNGWLVTNLSDNEDYSAMHSDLEVIQLALDYGWEGDDDDDDDDDKYADGGEILYVVKYKMKDTGKVVEQQFDDKDSADLFLEIMAEDEDVELMPLEEIKPSAPKPKKNIFASAKPVQPTGSKKKRERVEVDGIADKIRRYDELKAILKVTEAEQKLLAGELYEVGREKFLDLYEERGYRPANFDLADGNENILLEVTDRYLKVEPEKAEILKQYDGLLEEKTTYEFDNQLLEKPVAGGVTIGDIVSELIQGSKLIPDEDKANLIKAKKSMRVPKGTLDRLLEYDNPREVFMLISPVLALK